MAAAKRSELKRHALKTRKTLRQLLGRDAFTPSRKKGLTTRRQFEERVRAMQRQIKRHLNQNPIKLGRISISITTSQMTLTAKDIISASRLERKLIKKPKTAAMLAEKLGRTRDAKHFARIAEKAAEKARQKKAAEKATQKKAAEKARREKHRAFAEKQKASVRKVLERKADLAKAERKWAERNKRIKQAMLFERKKANQK